MRSGDALLLTQTAPTASHQETGWLEKRSVLEGLLSTAEPRTGPAFHQSCFTRSSADGRSASQTGCWIGTVLEAQRPRCRHHPAPTLEFLSQPDCPLPHPLPLFPTLIARQGVDSQRIADDTAAVTFLHPIATLARAAIPRRYAAAHDQITPIR